METTDLREQQISPTKYAGLGAATIAQLIIGLWFGVGVMLAVGAVDGLDHFVQAVARRK